MGLKKSIVLAVFNLLVLLLFTDRDASATPVYARQTGMSCSACHFQRYPLLNAFGREFKAKGYVMTGKQELIEDENLSLTPSLNAAFVSKFRYQKKNGTATTGIAGELNDGQFQIPDEAFLAIGGRVTENIGFQVELNFVEGEPLFSGFKMPFVFQPTKDITLSAIPFTTYSQGPAYGFELLNTGALRFNRAFEHRKETSAQQYMETSLEATGLALVAYHKYGYINYTPYIREQGTNFSSGQYLHYIRGAVTPKVGKWDLAAGFQIWTGDSKLDHDGEPTEKEHGSAWAIDAQAQGKVGKLPLGVYLTYGCADKSEPGKPNIYNSKTGDDKTAWTIATELGVIPYKLSVGAAYRNANTGAGGADTDNAVTLGLNYMLAQNVGLQLNHTMYSGDVTSDETGDALTTLMLYSAF